MYDLPWMLLNIVNSLDKLFSAVTAVETGGPGGLV